MKRRRVSHLGLCEPVLLVVDDDEIVQRTVSRLLRVHGTPFALGSGGEAIRFLESQPIVEAAIIDFRLDDVHTGLDVLDALRAGGSCAPALLFTAYFDPKLDLANEALLRGAHLAHKSDDRAWSELFDAFLHDSKPVRLRACVDAVARRAGLSPKEQQCILARLEGAASDKEIAAHIETTPATVNSCRRRAKDKLGMAPEELVEMHRRRLSPVAPITDVPAELWQSREVFPAKGQTSTA